MGLSHAELQQGAREHLLLHFTKHGTAFADDTDLLILDRGEGPYVFDTTGRRYIDSLSSLYCAQLGYSFGEEMGAAIAGQLSRLAFNTTWGTAHPAAIELAQALADRMPGDLDRVFFTSGGSESVESAFKIAREHFIAIGQPARHKAIARQTAYHGVTLGALSFTGVPGYKTGFGPSPIDVTHVSNTNAFRAPDGDDPVAFCARLLAEVRAAVAAAGPDEVAMIIAEPVQNAGGCFVAPPGYWAGLRAIADECGALLVSDEVICGFGRLGHWLGIEREGVVPDMATVAKGLTSAYATMGAVLISERVAAPLLAPGAGPLRHGITFGGHPASAAVALKNIELFEREGVLENVLALEDHLETRLQELRALPIVGDVRGRGFFWATELVGDGERRFDQAERDRLIRGFLPGRLREAGLIARADDRGDAVVQIAPPLIADADLLDEIVDRLGEVLTDAGVLMGLGDRAAA